MKLSDLTLSGRIADLIDANKHLDVARNNLPKIGIWYSREGVPFVGTRAEYELFVLSGE